MPGRPIDPLAFIEKLVDAGVDFIIVGGVAAVLHGSPTFTADFDIVHRRTPENVDRLIRLLGTLEAHFRNDLGGRKLLPGPSHLLGKGQILLGTSLGPLDCLCVLHDQRGYDELLPLTVEKVIEGRRVRVLDLQTLIEVKTAAGREKDKIAVGHLLRILRKQ